MKDKGRFLKIYSNLPLDVRKEIVVIIDKKPLSWDVAYQEIDQETKLGERILKKLIELNFV